MSVAIESRAPSRSTSGSSRSTAQPLGQSEGDVRGNKLDGIISQLLMDLFRDLELESSVDGGEVCVESADVDLITMVGPRLGNAWQDGQHIRSIAKQAGV